MKYYKENGTHGDPNSKFNLLVNDYTKKHSEKLQGERSTTF